MYKCWYDYFKPKYGDKAKLCYTEADSFIIHSDREFMLENYKDCLFNGEVILKSQQRFKSNHNVCTEEINKIALSGNDDKRLQTSDRIKISIWNKCF